MSDHHPHHGPDHVAQPGGGTNVIDPVCGMTVDPAKSRRSEHEGKSYFFCSEGCLTKFEDDPAGILAAFYGKTDSEMGSEADGEMLPLTPTRISLLQQRIRVFCP